MKKSTFVFSQEGTLKCITNNPDSLVKDSTDILIESEIVPEPNKIYRLVDNVIVSEDFIPDTDIITESLWQQIRDQRNKLLSETDWIVVKHTESGEPIPDEWKVYRQTLRDITTQTDVNNIVWPEKPQ